MRFVVEIDLRNGMTEKYVVTADNEQDAINAALRLRKSTASIEGYYTEKIA